MYFAFKTYPGGGAFALFFHPHPREFATQNKKSANARGLARGGDGRSWNWLMHNAETTGSNPVEAPKTFFSGFFAIA